jgi:O-antigen ligase
MVNSGPMTAVETPSPAPAPTGPGVAERRERWALRVLQAGAPAVVLLATTYKTFELDRYFMPKELVLHVTAVVAGLLAVRAFRRAPFTWVDLLLLGYLALGAVSAVLATNPWLAGRALAISISGVVVFWTARSLACAGLARPLLGAVAVAVVAGSVTALLQTYGVETELFSVNRAPGGTLGNRNFISHMAAFGVPVLLLVTVTAHRFTGYVLGLAGTMIVIASLVLTRSRAGWLAFAAAMLVLAAAMLVSRALRRDRRIWLRLVGVLLLAGAGVAGAILVPNELRWSSESPYMDSIRGVANYQEGSGRGRLVQYEHSLRMAARHPLLGVGPGNWAVEYPDHAAPSDPSLDRSTGGVTSNPWPSSDWVAVISERGFPAAILLLLAFVIMLVSALRWLVAATEPAQAFGAAALLAMIAAAAVAGTFDAVLLLALPTLLVWAALGALWVPILPLQPTGAGAPPRRASRRFAAAALVTLSIIAGIGALRSAAQVAAIAVYPARDDVAALRVAALIDPGNYRVRLRLARDAPNREQRCSHARAAHAQFPHAHEARNLQSGC